MDHSGSVDTIAFSRDGKSILTGSDDNNARLWDAATGRPIGPPFTHQGEVTTVAFSPDARVIVTGSTDNKARLWRGVDPVVGDPGRIRLWCEVFTGQELDSNNAVRFLEPTEWDDRRKRLDEMGGPPMP
jgi:eukaryotic-like serine/threonine-protein kinase